jgi:hypothetical protein
MLWQLSYRADPAVLPLADRHYNRQKPGTPQFVPPGSCLVLKTPACDAVWVTSWPHVEYVKHAWGGAWVCSLFRNESSHRASDLIRQAVAATLWCYGASPLLGMITFIDERHVRPIMTHGKATWGRTWVLAGFRAVGRTRGGLLAYQLLPGDMPPAAVPEGAQLALWEKTA